VESSTEHNQKSIKVFIILKMIQKKKGTEIGKKKKKKKKKKKSNIKGGIRESIKK
jgi:hypothetical protein